MAPVSVAARPYFVAYDVFGYLFPGLVVTSAVAIAFPPATGVAAEAVKSGSGVAAVLLVAYFAGHVMAAFSSLLLERFVLRLWMGYPTRYLFRHQKARWFELRSYTRPYSRQFRARFESEFEARFGMPARNEHDMFWLAWSYNSLHHPAAFRRGTHFLNLYGFARNLSFALLVAAAIPVLPGSQLPIAKFWWVAGFAVSALAMFLAYTRFLHRLNDEVYRGFVAVTAAADSTSDMAL